MTYVKFILGGKTDNLPGFNGQFQKATLKLGPGAFVDKVEQLKELKDEILGVKPVSAALLQPSTVKVVDQIPQKTAPQNKTENPVEYKVVTTQEKAFPEEYAVSGWFKKTGNYTEDVHFVFRLTSNNQAENTDKEKLGDRTLALFAHKSEVYQFATYTVKNLNGEGNPNVV